MIIKCKMCGGDIQFEQGASVGQCDHCGSSCTIPKVDEEQKLNRYNRANHYRRQCEFDKAITAYERILEEDDTDAEAHWGIVLSRYGIEYVEDPVTKRRVPTCHRVQVESILADADYQAALQNAPDTASRSLYEEQAKEIAEIQKGILAISRNEKPYDVFICYKETDESGQRTRDSALAQEIYYGLTEQGYKVFFSRITLEDKLGQEYEPYIFAALNSARVMVVVGTKPEYFTAVWVKNEWSRYLHLMKSDRKRLLIPCYRDMDPYDLPEELSNLQSQDMSRIGFIQDLLRGVRKVLDAEKTQASAQKAEAVKAAPQAVSGAAPGVSSLMERARLFLEDGDFQSAQEYLDRVLDIDPKHAPAYAAKVCTALHLWKEADLAETTFLYEDNLDWQKALRFADPQQKTIYTGYAAKVKERVTRQIRDYAYDCAVEMAMNPRADRSQLDSELEIYKETCIHSAGKLADGSRRPYSQPRLEALIQAVQDNEPGEISEVGLKTAAAMFEAINDDEASERAEQCITLAEQARQKAIYRKAVSIQNYKQNSPSGLEEAALLFQSIPDYMDAGEKKKDCFDKAESIRSGLYESAVNTMNTAGEKSSKWHVVKEKLAETELTGYRDVAQLRTYADKRYNECVAADQEAKEQAEERLKRKATKKKSYTLLGAVLIVAAILIVTLVIIPGSNYQEAVALKQAGKYEEAIVIFEALNGYSDSEAQIEACRDGIKERDYQEAIALQQAGKYEEAIAAFEGMNGYSDSAKQMIETKYLQGKALASNGEYKKAAAVFMGISGHKDVDSLLANDDNLAAAATSLEAKLARFRMPGNMVTLGKYEQDNNSTNGPEKIEWIVLDYHKASNKALLLSRYGLDAMAYNSTFADITWEKCTLRAWLNDEFLNEAFSADEQSAILTTKVDNTQSQGYSKWNTDGGKNTEDRIFLLSYAEANRYLRVTSDSNKNMKSRVAPTAYALAQGAEPYNHITVDEVAAGWWWLRSPGSYQNFVAVVLATGSLLDFSVNYDSGVVRPAFWINLDSGIF